MQRMRSVYAMLLVAIYVAASALSSLSLIFCEHHHSNHQHAHHEPTCVCHGISFDKDCCNHVHPVLGDTFTEYIASSQRNETRITDQCNTITSYALLATAVEVVTITSEPTAIVDYGDEAVPLVAAFIGQEALRGPPALA